MPGVPARRPMRLRAGADVPVVLELFDLVGAHPVRLLGGLNAFRRDLEFHQRAQGHDQLGQRALVVRARDDGLVDPAGTGWGLPRPGWLRRTPARCDPVPWWCTWSGRRCAAGSRCRGRPAGPGLTPTLGVTRISVRQRQTGSVMVCMRRVRNWLTAARRSGPASRIRHSPPPGGSPGRCCGLPPDGLSPCGAGRQPRAAVARESVKHRDVRRFPMKIVVLPGQVLKRTRAGA